MIWFAKYVALKASIIMMLTKNSYGVCCHDNVEFLSIGQKKMTEDFTKLQK